MNIEEKTKLAHEVLLKLLDKVVVPQDFKDSISLSWAMVDAMEVEAEKRIKATAEKNAEESKVFFEKLTKNEDGSCKHFHTTLNGSVCFDCGEDLNSTDSSQLEWQPDWSVAPSGMITHWSKESNGTCTWWIGEPCIDGETHFENPENPHSCCHSDAPSFNYQGDWKQSLRKRP